MVLRYVRVSRGWKQAPQHATLPHTGVVFWLSCPFFCVKEKKKEFRREGILVLWENYCCCPLVDKIVSRPSLGCSLDSRLSNKLSIIDPHLMVGGLNGL